MQLSKMQRTINHFPDNNIRQTKTTLLSNQTLLLSSSLLNRTTITTIKQISQLIQVEFTAIVVIALDSKLILRMDKLR
jgi:hypothetical protein